MAGEEDKDEDERRNFEDCCSYDAARGAEHLKRTRGQKAINELQKDTLNYPAIHNKSTRIECTGVYGKKRGRVFWDISSFYYFRTIGMRFSTNVVDPGFCETLFFTRPFTKTQYK
jgi:hypothetical protein